MAQSTTNLGKIHVFPSETLYNQFKDIIADNDLALLKDDGAYIVAALLEKNGYVKFSNGLILQWGVVNSYRVTVTFPLAYTKLYCLNAYMTASSTSTIDLYSSNVTLKTFDIMASVPDDAYASFDMAFWLSLGI